MLDLKFIRDNQDKVAWAIGVKGINLDLQRLLELDASVTSARRDLQELQTERNAISAAFPKASPSERDELKEQSRAVGDRISGLQADLNDRETELRDLMLAVPNIPHDDAPVGPDDGSNIVVETHGEVPDFDFDVRDHVDILELNDWADFGGAAKVAGSRSYVLKGDLALLEMSLLALAMQRLGSEGFTPVAVPALVREGALVGTGHLPASREDIYAMPEEELFLAGTAEVALTSLHSGDILAEADLPKLYVGFSPCFRREAGSAGRDVRGLLRVHQFNKVEQYVICPGSAEASWGWHDAILGHAKAFVSDLELPFQVVECCTGDMGAGKHRMHDIETWLPSQRKYRETHSCSSLLDWQARRANLRYRDADGQVHYAHTLNNTLLATPRILAQFVECHQQADGSVYLPPIIRSAFGGRDRIGGPEG